VRVKILDFGIAKIKRSAASGGTMRTQAGLIMGSPAYMSPEQCKDSADVDLRSDIYSFGVIIYEALSGKPPFLAASPTEILVMQLTAIPTPLCEGLAHVPAYVEAAVMRALAKERAERFDSVAVFVNALRGEGVITKVGSARSPLPEASAAASGQPSSDATMMAGAPAVTTFSRATGEVGVSASDEALPTVARHRRWPVLALGGLAVVGLALFLLVRPSHRPTPREATSNAGVAVPAAHPAAPPPQQGGAPVPVLLGAPDAGAATAPSASAPPIGRSSSAAPAAARAAARPSPSATERRHQVGKKKADDEWELH
jgi:serine/threonine-protein kinase